MRFAPIITLTACSLALSGCVAAVFIPVAGGALLRDRIENRNNSGENESIAAGDHADKTIPAKQEALVAQALAEPESVAPAQAETAGDAYDAYSSALSSGDYEVIDALPAPTSRGGQGAGASRMFADQAWKDFVSFTLKASSKAKSPEGEDAEVLSALLVEPTSLTPEMMTCQNKPMGVVIDLDPQGGPLPLEDGAATPQPSPSLEAALASLREQDISIFWITDHSAANAGKVRQFLRASLLDPEGADPLMVMRYPGEKKQARRSNVGQTHCLIAIAGDERSDFDELYDFLREPSAAAELESLLGNGWFLTAPLVDAADIHHPSPAIERQG